MKNGEEVIYEEKVALHPWTLGSLGPGTKRLRLSSSNISIEGLPQIPLASIRGCEIKSFFLTPYVSLQFADSLGEVKRISLYHPAFLGEGTRPQVKRLYNLIVRARDDKVGGADLKEFIRQAYALEEKKKEKFVPDLERIFRVNTKSRLRRAVICILLFIATIIVIGMVVGGMFFKVGPLAEPLGAISIGAQEFVTRVLIAFAVVLIATSIMLWKKK